MSYARGVSHSVRRNPVDPPLIKLVEEYLHQYKHLSFINLDHMGDIVKQKSFRYSRMKHTAFKEQLRKAYEQYSESANRSMEEFSGANIEVDDTPLTDETLKEMEGYPSSDSGSDLLIDESPIPEKDAGIDQMKNLYKAANNPEDIGDRSTVSTSTNAKESRFLDGKMANKSVDKTDCVSICSSATDMSNLSGKSESKKGKSLTLANEKTTFQHQTNDEDDSESDLEIIEEVHNERHTNSVITNGYGRPSLIQTSNVQGNSVQPQPQKTGVPVHVQTSASAGIKEAEKSANNFQKKALGALTDESQTPKKAETPGSSRGVKRKQTENDPSQGISDDLTRKRPRKEVTVVHDTGYKLHDFAGSDKVVEEICKLLMHLKHPEVYQTLGVTPPRGFLLHGPPGTGKTLLANAIAGELQTPMLKVAGTELVSGISGESESNIRELFNQAVAIAPCIIFIDEIDSVTPRRENVNKEMERRIVAQLLSCIDDLTNKEKGNQVLLIGATNRIEAIDTALRRAGRFDREICLGIPDESSREKILSVICRDLKLESGFEVRSLARLTPGYVGADLQALIREAAVQAVNRKLLSQSVEVESKEIEQKSTEEEIKHTELQIAEKETSQTDPSTAETEVVQSEASTVEAEPKQIKSEPQNVTAEDPAKEMEVDEQSVSEKAIERTAMLNNSISSSKKQHEVSQSIATTQVSNPMRWIKETAPLSAEELNDLFVTMNDFKFALKNVQPSSKREGFATVPDTTWDDIGALKNIRDELQVSILGPVKHAEAFKKLGLTTPAGVLLCGPPGCGKTLLAKAVANEAGINFISVKGPELLNMYVGESERAVRQCFLRARNSSPCVIFFDELDALCPRRSDVADSGSSGRIVNQLLTEMDGIESRQGVYVMAASNRPDIIDPAVLRPGRLDKILFVNLPTAEERFEILKALTKNSSKPVLADDVNLEVIANCSECEDYTGADLAALVREASIASFRELVMNAPSDIANSKSENELKVHMRHFTIAFTKTKPSVGKDDRLKYKLMAERYSSIR